jgi:hypothetical protein
MSSDLVGAMARQSVVLKTRLYPCIYQGGDQSDTWTEKVIDDKVFGRNLFHYQKQGTTHT